MPHYRVTTLDGPGYSVMLGKELVASCRVEGDARLIAKLLNEHAASVAKAGGRRG